MGYTHYWYRPKEIPADKMADIAADFSRLVPYLCDLGVFIADGHGKGFPTIDKELVCFNGLAKCGHAENAKVVIPWPSKDASGVASGPGEIAGHWFAGAVLDTRRCNGDCSYETVYFPRVMPADSFFQEHNRDGYGTNTGTGLFFGCCKTAYRPYDLAVNAFLVIAKHHLGDRCLVSSDGEIQHWLEGIALCRLHLLYPETYDFSEDGHLEPIAKPARTALPA